MKRYPLQTLLQLRAHRTEAARRVVLDRQRALQHGVSAGRPMRITALPAAMHSQV